MSLILSPNQSERDGRGDILARSHGRSVWQGARMSNCPEFVSSVDAGDGAGIDSCDRQAATDDCGRGCAGNPPPAKEPHTCHFYLLNQVNFENHCGADTNPLKRSRAS